MVRSPLTLAFVGMQWPRSQVVPVPTPTKVPQVDSLSGWLLENKAYLPSRIDTDEHGLRGLTNPINKEHICSISRKCIIVADSNSLKNNKRPIDALAETLLKELELGDVSHYYPYISHMPSEGDLSLAGIGCVWTDEQLQRLGNEPTIKHFQKLRTQRDKFVQRNQHFSSTLAALAFDLATSRALQGPFGRSGTIRAGVTGCSFAFLMALAAPLFHPDLSASILLESFLPVLPSIAVLVHSLTANKELAMLPWIDIANHKSNSKLYLQYGILQDNIVLKISSPIDSSASSIDESCNNFVTFDYGGSIDGSSNDKLLGEYGFVEKDNPNDYIDFTVRGTAVKLRRNGRLDCSHVGVLLDDVKSAAKELRQSLALVDTLDEDVATEEVDILRSCLASQWRNEKIRLLDEFIS